MQYDHRTKQQPSKILRQLEEKDDSYAIENFIHLLKHR